MENKKLYFCSLDDLKKKKYIVKFFDSINDELIIFIDKYQKVKIFSSICPHFGGEIIYNDIKNLLQCKWHGWKFDKNTGKCLSYPIRSKLNEYEFKQENNKIYIIVYD